jgi:hypothetical protein
MAGSSGLFCFKKFYSAMAYATSLFSFFFLKKKKNRGALLHSSGEIFGSIRGM